MKRIIYQILTLVGVLALGSCSSEDLASLLGEGNQVTFTAQLPTKISSRAFSDGTSAKNLTCYIYQKDDDGKYTYVTEQSTTVADDLTAKVSFKLMKDETYAAVFWAQAEDAPFTINAETGIVDMNYSDNNEANNENRDAFYYRQEDFTVKGNIDVDVTLTRPFAQVNIGASDISDANAAGYKYTTATVTASTYTSLDALSGSAVGEVEDVTFTNATFPSSWSTAEIFPVTDDVDDEGNAIVYDYLSMNYLLVNSKQELIDVTISLPADEGSTLTNEKSFTYTNVPVQRNYRTNIYGTLFTDQVQYKVKLDKEYESEYNIKIEGESEPKTSEEDANVYLITTQAELIWLAESVNAGEFFIGKTFSLQNDIYLIDEWTPIGRDYSSRFTGKFLGNGHTIYNLHVTANERAGFFGFLNGQVEDLNFADATVVSNHWAGVVAGFSDNETGSMYIKNCKVTNSSVTLSAEYVDDEWDNGDKGGLIIGYIASKDQVENCTVENCTLQGYRDLGGIVGYSNHSVITNNTVNNLTITVDNEHNYKNYTTIGTGGNDANPVIGDDQGTESGNTYSNVTIVTPIADGVLETVDGNYYISSVAGLQWVADQVNGGSTFKANNKRQTITLTSDLDLKGIDWTPIGNVNSYPSISLHGIFDGDGHTISNLTSTDLTTTDNATAGLFGSLIGVVKNLTVKNVNITSQHYAGAIVGYSSANGCTIENCHVIGGTITSIPELFDGGYDNGDKVGGIIGYNVSGDKVIGCSVDGLTIQGYRDIGGIVGCSSATITDCTVTNTTIIQDNTNGYKESIDTYAEIVGRDLGTTLSNNTYSNVTLLTK